MFMVLKAALTDCRVQAWECSLGKQQHIGLLIKTNMDGQLTVDVTASS